MGTIIFFVIAGTIIYIIVNNSNAKTKRTIELREAYDVAIRSGDKTQALKAGRAYYSFLRKGNLTIYDEQAMTNDLSTMK